MEVQRNQSAAFHGQAAVQSNFLGGATEKSHGGPLQQAFSGGVDQPQNLIRIECEQRHFNLFDDAAQQSRGFNGSNTLLGEEISQSVYLKRQLTQRIIRGCAACPKGIVLFPQGGNDVSQGLQWPSGLLVQRRRQQPPHEQFDEGQSQPGLQ